MNISLFSCAMLYVVYLFISYRTSIAEFHKYFDVSSCLVECTISCITCDIIGQSWRMVSSTGIHPLIVLRLLSITKVCYIILLLQNKDISFQKNFCFFCTLGVKVVVQKLWMKITFTQCVTAKCKGNKYAMRWTDMTHLFEDNNYSDVTAPG